MLVCSNQRCQSVTINEKGRCAQCQALPVDALIRHRYAIKQLIGQGGFGTTYLVYDQDCFDEARILKELFPRTGAHSEEQQLSLTAKRLFQREAKVLLNLHHRGIPKLHAYFNENDFFYLVQDYIPGWTLAEEMERENRAFTEAEARQILWEVGDILEYLHSQNPPILHRDIKPQNLMRHKNGQILLIDFGAVYQATTSSFITGSQTLIGSPGYAPPEQIFGHPTPQSDLYALGATLVRLLSGLHPSQLFNNRTQQLEWQKHVKVTPRFYKLLTDLLTRDVNKRTASATALKEQLQNLEVLTDLDTASESPRGGIDLSNTLSSATITVDSEEASAAKLYVPDESGDISHTPFLFLLGRLALDKFSGTAIFTNQEVSRTLFLHEGSINFVHSSCKEESFSQVIAQEFAALLPPKKLQLLENSNQARDDYQLVRNLVNDSDLSIEALKPILLHHLHGICLSLLTWKHGSYELLYQSLTQTTLRVNMTAAEILFPVLAQLNNATLLEDWLGDFQRTVRITEAAVTIYQTIHLDPKSAFVASRIERPMKIQEITSLAVFPEIEVLQILCGLLALGIIEFVYSEVTPKINTSASSASLLMSPPKAPTPTAPLGTTPPITNAAPINNTPSTTNNNTLPNTPSAPINLPISTSTQSPISSRTTNNLPPITAPVTIPTARETAVELDIQSIARFCYEVEETLGNVEAASSYYGMLGVLTSATEHEIQIAYENLQEKFDVTSYANIITGNPDLKRKLERLTNHLAKAFEVLYNRSLRENYDRQLVGKGMKVSSPNLPIRENVKDREAMRESLREKERSGEIKPETKSLTPERSLAAGNAPPSPEKKPPTGTLPPIEKKTPTGSLPSVPTTSASTNTHSAEMFGAKRDRATAQKWFSKGLEYFDTQQFSQACRAFQAAVAAYPDNGEYHFYLACSLYSTNMAMEAEQEFYRALELSANNPDYYAAFAIFYLQQNLPQMAREMFAKVRDIDPNHSTLAEYKDFLTRKRSS